MLPKNHHHIVLHVVDKRVPDKKKDQSIPIIVAFISGFFAIASVIVQITIQNNAQKNIARLIEQEKTIGQQSGQTKFLLNKNFSDLLVDIDRGFDQLCNFSYDKKSITQKSLVSSLTKFREQLEKAASLEPQETLNDLEVYSEYVAEQQYRILYSHTKLIEEQKKHYYLESQELRRKAQKAISNL